VTAQPVHMYPASWLSPAARHGLMIQSSDGHALNLTDIPSVLRDWREPRHPQFVTAGNTAWRLFNAATETIKGDLWRLPARTRAIHDVFDEVCGLTFDQNL